MGLLPVLSCNSHKHISPSTKFDVNTPKPTKGGTRCTYRQFLFLSLVEGKRRRMDPQHPLPLGSCLLYMTLWGVGWAIEYPDARLRLVDINFINQPKGGNTAINSNDQPNGENITKKSVTTSKHSKGIPACINDS